MFDIGSRKSQVESLLVQDENGLPTQGSNHSVGSVNVIWLVRDDGFVETEYAQGVHQPVIARLAEHRYVISTISAVVKTR